MNVTSRKWLVGLVVMLAVVAAAVVLMVGRTPAQVSLPNPNGYDDLVKAGQEVTGPVGDFLKLNQGELKALVATNAESLRLLRVGLSRECRMPLDFALTNAAGPTMGLTGMKRLAQLLAAEGRLQEMANRPGEAARSYTDAIRLGNEMSRGALLIGRLVGIACESIGSQALARVVPRLSREEDQEILAVLNKIDANRVTWAEVRESESKCARYHWRSGINPIVLIGSWWNTRQAVGKGEARHKTVVAYERLLAKELALRCYQADKTCTPVSLNELTTNYLSRLPQDPFTGKPLIYRPQQTNWVLYSTGPDGVDHGGKPAKGDLFYNSL